MMNYLRPLTAVLGVGCLVVGFWAALSSGTAEHVTALGNSLVIAGAVIIAGAIISSAIARNGGKG